MIIFDGNKLAAEREAKLKEKISQEIPNKKLVIAAILFQEDAGSQ